MEWLMSPEGTTVLLERRQARGILLYEDCLNTLIEVVFLFLGDI